MTATERATAREAAGPVLVRWPGPCWVLLIETHDDSSDPVGYETHHPDRAGAQADLDDRLVQLAVEDLDDALDQFDDPDQPERAGWPVGRRLADVVTDVPRRGQDAAARLDTAAIYWRPGCCWGLLCRRCARPRDLAAPDDSDGDGDDGAGWTHVGDRDEALRAASGLGAVCADCAAAAALGSVAGPDGALLPDPPTFPTFPTGPTVPPAPITTATSPADTTWLF